LATQVFELDQGKQIETITWPAGNGRFHVFAIASDGGQRSPVPSADPAIAGGAAAEVGQELRMTDVTWDPPGTTMAYQWRRDGVDIDGATQATYIVQTADIGAQLTARVTASFPGYRSSVFFTAAVAISAPDRSAELAALVASLDLSVQGGTSPADWSAYLNALHAAEVLVTSGTTSYPEVSSAIDALNAAVATLRPAPTTDLVELVSATQALSGDGYTEETWQGVLDAVAAALATAGRAAGQLATVEEVGQAREDLIAAVAALALVSQPAPVDYAVLAGLVDLFAGMNVRQAEYTEVSWNRYATALGDARTAVEDQNAASQTVVNGLRDALADAFGQLDRLPDVSNLAVAIAAVEALDLDPDAYTEESFGRLGSALEGARAVVRTGGVGISQNQVEAALTAVNRELGRLEAVQPVVADPQAGVRVLGSLEDDAGGLDAEGYTETSWARLDVALRVARVVLGDGASSAELVEEATVALASALAALVPATPTAPPSTPPASVSAVGLAVLTGAYMALRPAGYSAASWAVFRAALDAAELVRTDPAASQAQTEAAFADLVAAAAGLVAIETPAPAQTVEVRVPGPVVSVPAPGVTVTAPAPSPTAAPTPAPSQSVGPEGTTETPPAAAPTAVVKVKVSQTTVRLRVGGSLRLTGAGYQADGATSKVSWTSSDRTIASVSALGKITAKKAGRATITVKAGGKTARVKVTVVAKKTAQAKVTQVRASGLPSTMAVGQVAWASPTWKPATAIGVRTTYRSSNSAVIAIDRAGRAVARSAGATTIAVTAGAKTTTYTITVK
jgi:hypothetical protein